MKRTTIYLPDEIHMALRREALDQHVTMAELIRRMSAFCLESDRRFWSHVDRLRSGSREIDPVEAERVIMTEVKQVRREHRSSRTRR